MLCCRDRINGPRLSHRDKRDAVDSLSILNFICGTYFTELSFSCILDTSISTKSEGLTVEGDSLCFVLCTQYEAAVIGLFDKRELISYTDFGSIFEDFEHTVPPMML